MLPWREWNVPQKPPTTYMFGPLIDAPPSHPDTVLTTLSYFEKTLTELGMKTSNLSADMQLYIVATLIKWASHGNRFKSVILRPGGMHTLMSFNDCIGNLMKGNGPEVLVGAAFGGLTSIMNGKAWVKSIRAFRMVTAALLYDFLKDGPNTFKNISQYLDVAREHPTGRFCVDCLIRPTLIAQQFERGFHAPVKRKAKTMESIKCGVTIGDNTLYDMASLFCRLITVGQHQQVELQTLFEYELCAVPTSIIDENGCLRIGTQSTLVSKLKVDDLQPDALDIVIVDGQQLLYHIVWPFAGSASDLANSMKDRLGQYQPTEVLVIFDRYDDRSAKDHKRIRRAGEGAVNYNITI